MTAPAVAPATQTTARTRGMPTAAVASRVTSKAAPCSGAGVDAVSGGRVGLSEAAEAPRPLGVGLQRPVHLGLVEVGPVGGRAVELGVGRLPEEEVGDAHLAGGSGPPVGGGQAGAAPGGGEEG